MQLSVVVTIVEGGETLAVCLAALLAQIDAPQMEIVVPVDASAGDLRALRGRWPTVRFVDLGTVDTQKEIASEAGRHELYDRRRALGLDEARGALVAILEDRGVPRPDWARQMLAAHASSPGSAAVGGAIENGVDAVLSWAAYFCDFGRQGLPLPAGPAHWVSDVNIAYRREALLGVRAAWKDGYQEPTVHAALRSAGESLRLDPRPVVEQRRRGLRFLPLLAERWHWGRLFGAIRAAELGAAHRLAFAAACPLLPLLLWGRHLRDRLSRRRLLGVFARATPAMLCLLVAWSFGEGVGYLTRRR